MRRMDETLRKQIDIYRKNKLDISDLIKDYYIKDENISGCVIKVLNRIGEDISNCNMSGCIIGQEGYKTLLSRAIMRGCNFKNATFLGIVLMKHIDARNCNFSESTVPFVEYQHGDFTNCNFCDTVWRLGSRAGHSAKFSKEVFEKWGLKIS